jgi:hypothetical protein
MTTHLEYDGIVTSSRSCIALLCLAVLCLAALTPVAALLLWALVLPFCFAFSMAVTVVGLVDCEDRTCRVGFYSLVPARAPPAVS